MNNVKEQRTEQTLVESDYQKAVSYLDVVSHVPTVWAAAKEWLKSRSVLEQNKTCQRCLLCKSNAPHVATEISVGGRLQSFWQVWQNLGLNSRVVSILKGHSLPFRERPPLSRVPLIVSKYANPLKKKYLAEALTSLVQKQAVERPFTTDSF